MKVPGVSNMIISPDLFYCRQDLNLIPPGQIGGARNPADPAARRLQGGGAAAAAAAAAVGGVVAAAGGGGMANEGRWTDNGQPLTPAEGRTVMPMLDQVEQAIVARLLPSQTFDPTAPGGDGAQAGAGGGSGGGTGQVIKKGTSLFRLIRAGDCDVTVGFMVEEYDRSWACLDKDKEYPDHRRAYSILHIS